MKDGHATASRAALLELRQEREVVQEGHRFLDEKRVLLAREILRRLAAYEAARSELRETERLARGALDRALGLHGLEHLQVHAPPEMATRKLVTDAKPFLGMQLPEASLDLAPAAGASFESDATRDCAAAYARLAREAAALAAAESALLRLAADYRRTERRVRALENLILPELRHDERVMAEILEENEMEEAIRVRLFAGNKTLLS